jgi:hypothetical protein
MTDDVHFGDLQHSLIQPDNNLFLGQDRNAPDANAQDYHAQDRCIPGRPAHHGQKAITEMVIGAWYLDEFGNPTREIKARD